MGLIQSVMSFVFGDGRNVVAETAEVFRENADKAAARRTDVQTETLKQFAAEFAHPRKGVFDRFIDGVNRLPRPMLALGTIALFVSAMFDPEWFSSRMTGIALVPEPLWWLMGAIVSFYFGARHQAKGQEFQRAVASTVAVKNLLEVSDGPVQGPAPEPKTSVSTVDVTANAALAEWQARHAR